MIQSTLSTTRYVLGIDGGGTKTVARLTQLGTKKSWQAQSGASSLTNDLAGAVDVIAKLCKNLVFQSGVHYEQISAVFGLAGSGNKNSVQQLRNALAMPFENLIICSDAKTSAYGANNGQAVAIVALGTGSVGMRLDNDGQSELVGGWGFIAGDEGGGAKLGLAAVKETLIEFEQYKKPNSEVAVQICQCIGKTRVDILTWLSRAKPSDYANFSPLIFSSVFTCPLAKKLIALHTKAVEKLIKLTIDGEQLPLVLLGGLAKVTQPYLSAEYQQQLVEPKGDSLDGACFLAEQFYL